MSERPDADKATAPERTTILDALIDRIQVAKGTYLIRYKTDPNLCYLGPSDFRRFAMWGSQYRSVASTPDAPRLVICGLVTVPLTRLNAGQVVVGERFRAETVMIEPEVL